MPDDTVDCNALQKVRGVTLLIDGLALKVIYNALVNYKEYEPETCETCTATLDEMLNIAGNALDHIIEHTKEQTNQGDQSNGRN